ncbi:centrosomal protein of 162 kDa isoform X2 [Pleuronectes platessa]|uniref:centrosomal protein of 162 kDa isoform X2 n=1 Tax=Pleuronectes platessa TaxID=8262 RepID=UPI00232A6632|nr:centrosomal protein of 162 kDa isoform X2 [Pleuronectes platessa]
MFTPGCCRGNTILIQTRKCWFHRVSESSSFPVIHLSGLPLADEWDRITMSLSKEDLDEQFELFLKESVSDDSVDLGGSEKQPCAKRSQKSAPKPAALWWQDDEDSGGGAERGLSGSGKSFRKSLRKSHAIQEEDEGSVKEEAVVVSRDYTETEGVESMKVPAVDMNTMGLDTLEEEEEKAIFFAQLEAGPSSTIDYSKLNRELDSMSSSIGSKRRNAEEAVEQDEDGQRKARVTETPSLGSPHYSEDFEDEENEKDPVQKELELSPIIGKGRLFDSLDDTGGEDRKTDTAGSLDRGHSYVKSGGSEMEALHEAYRQIQVVEGSDDHNRDYLHSPVEGEGRLHRSVSSSFPPQHGRLSLQPASTNESDLPTAEELMRPIRIDEDHTRGFSLQPVSALQPVQEKPSCSLERTFPDVPYTESQLKGPRKAATKIKEDNEPNSPDHPNRDLKLSIREEVQRLMGDHSKTAPPKSSQAGKVKKQPASRSSNFSLPSTSSLKKPTLASARARKVEQRTALTSRSSGISKTAAAAKSHLPQRPSTATFTKSPERDDDTESALKVSSELVASVQSLVGVLQQQIHTSSPQETRPTHHLPNNNKDESSSLVTELRAELAQRERELQKMKEEAEELNALRQQIFLLQSKLRSAEEANHKTKRAEATDPATEGTLQKMDKEMKEQEILIKGYQQENEKLYSQMKAQQAQSKANEEAMFNENHRLRNELTSASTEKLIQTSRPVGNVCSMDHAQRITDLLAQINKFQRNEAKLSEEMHRLKQETNALEEELQLLKKERNLAKFQVISTSGDKTFEMRVLEEKHKEEVSGLKKKLQWLAENQELLDRDADRLKAATAQIQQLTDQVEKLKIEVGKRSGEQQRKAKEKTLDTKKMQDLQRQVKELEQILRNRNPNSLPALIYAAARAGAEEDVDAEQSPNRIVALLEARIQRLEAQLESHDEEAKRGLRAMEQRFHSVKLRYEQQISELEQQLETKQQVEEVNQPWMSQVQTLEKALQQEKESHQEKDKSLHDQIQSLQQQLKIRAQPSPGRYQRQAEAAVGVRIERLSHELATKTQTIQDLTRTVERLQKERRSMLSVPSPRAGTRSTENRRQPGPTKVLSSVTACGGEETFPAAHNEKTYQPTAFAGSHISEVLQENQALTQRVELLELQAEKEKKELKADAVQAKEELRRLREHSAEQLSSLKVEHLQVLDKLRAAHALEYSSSKVAEQANTIDAQEIKLKHLQEQLKELQGNKDALTVSRTRENALQRQLTKLLQELKEAKEAQSSEVKLLCGLERKILNMELRHQQRETELQQDTGGSWQMLEPQQQAEVERWKNLAQDKSRELKAFRLELDSILDFLKHLQRQGVVFPPS